MSGTRLTRSLPADLRVRESTRLLAAVMVLPLLDGIFPALVLSGALASPVGVAQVGLLVFGGSATVAVILSSPDADPRAQAGRVLAVGLPLVALAAVEAALAPTIGTLLDLAVFERFAAIVLLTVAAETASARVRDYLPRPAVVVGLGAAASLDPGALLSGPLPVLLEPALIARAATAAAVGVAFALSVVAARPHLRSVLDLDRFRFGSAVALGVLSLTVLGVVPAGAPLPLAVLGLAGLFAFDPGARESADAGVTRERDGADEVVDPASDAPTAEPPSSGNSSIPDGAGVESDRERAPWH